MRRQASRLVAAAALVSALLTVSTLSGAVAATSTTTTTTTSHQVTTENDYDTHAYYVVELDPAQLPLGHSIDDVARALGTDHVHPVGQLQHHYLVKASLDDVERGEPSWTKPNKPHNNLLHKRGWLNTNDKRDAVMERYDLLRRRLHGPASHLRRRDMTNPTTGRLSSRSAILSLERQTLRQRAKRDKPYLPLPVRLQRQRRSTYQTGLQARQGGVEPQQASFDGPVATAMFKFGITDPIFDKQWHLANEKIPQNSVNVTGVWEQDIFGQGINVAIVDDGLDMHSDDLADNFHAEGSWDYNDNTALPEPRLSDDQHGTRCAGEIAAVKNDVCGVGVAYKAGIAGIRILSAPISDADEASSLNYGFQTNDIYSCSWGPPDDGKSMEAPGRLIVKAMLNGIQKGRGGKGNIFVFASGNGGAVDDQCNFDGYTNSLMSITVGAIDRAGLHPFYSEACAANMVVTYSSGSGDNIHTTDVGKDKCTDRHGGTSAAAPIAAGIFALVLEARPDLNWRDMQHLCVRTAVQVNPDDPDWQMTASGRYYNHKYGYGKLDAYAIVEAAKTWQLVKPQTWWASQMAESGKPITAQGTTSTIVVKKDELTKANFEKLEHVTITVHIAHSRRGNIEVELDSPKGMKSILARPRRFDDDKDGMPGWVFMTVKHWDEDPVGTWTLRVKDKQKNGHNGTFTSWSMQLWGSAIDPTLTEPYRLPGDPDDEDATFDEDAVVSSSVVEPTKTYDRPTSHLPDDHAEVTGEAHMTFAESYNSVDLSQPTNAPAAQEDDDSGATDVDVDEELEDGETDDNDESSSGSFYDNLYGSTSGALSSMRELVGTTTWFFVAVGIVVVFVAAITAYLWMKRRPRLRGDSGYDFAPMTDDDDLPMSAMERGGLLAHDGNAAGVETGARRQSARTRELYNAFALHSDDEDESGDDDDDARREKGLYTRQATSGYSDEDQQAPFTGSDAEEQRQRRSSDLERQRSRDNL
ncbi:pheromone processing endoprotease [Microbotryomycetes sp. JL221]|nr:pheromone processing endoprotease [Microbotryomycetes sp. JL221]